MSSTKDADNISVPRVIILPGDRVALQVVSSDPVRHRFPTTSIVESDNACSLLPPADVLEKASCVLVRPLTLENENGPASGASLAYGRNNVGAGDAEVVVCDGYESVSFSRSNENAVPSSIRASLDTSLFARIHIFTGDLAHPKVTGPSLLSLSLSQRLVDEAISYWVTANPDSRLTCRVTTRSARVSGLVLALSSAKARQSATPVAFAKAFPAKSCFAHEGRVMQLTGRGTPSCAVSPLYVGPMEFNESLEMPLFVARYGGKTVREETASDVRKVPRASVQAFFRRYRKFQSYASMCLNKPASDRTDEETADWQLLAKSTALEESSLASVAAEEMNAVLTLLETDLKPFFAGILNDYLDAAEQLDLEDVLTRQQTIQDDYAAEKLTPTVLHGDMTASNILYDRTTRRLHAIDWSDASVGAWYMEGTPFVRYLAHHGDRDRVAVFLLDFVKTAVDGLGVPGDRDLERFLPLFELARPLRMLRRFIMTARLFIQSPGDPLSHTFVLDMIEYLVKTRKSLKRRSSCKDEDSNLSDMGSEDLRRVEELGNDRDGGGDGDGDGIARSGVKEATDRDETDITVKTAGEGAGDDGDPEKP